MKRLLLGFGLVVFSTFLLTACGSGNNPAPNQGGTTSQTGESGKTNTGVDAAAVFQTNCASCHGQNLEGSVGPALNHIGATLTKEQILSTIQNGKGIMPANIIQGEDAKAVAEWLSEKK